MEQTEKSVIVKLQTSKTRSGIRYVVTMPKQYVLSLNWGKGDYLKAVIIEYKIGDKTCKGVFYYKVSE
ncbi:MAG: hypothetical protein LM583_04820 [Desulfurococcaceae archaeon]|jgi:hypothetical protein|nr:hypothetical protein [Desulfurococcaceae archaeon]